MRFVLTVLITFILTGFSVSVFSEYGDIVLNSKPESMKKADVKPVVFPHWFHRVRFKCKACHERIFTMDRGANNISMRAIMKGEFCGKCHNGIVAWEPLYCDRCHSGKSGKK